MKNWLLINSENMSIIQITLLIGIPIIFVVIGYYFDYKQDKKHFTEELKARLKSISRGANDDFIE